MGKNQNKPTEVITGETSNSLESFSLEQLQAAFMAKLQNVTSEVEVLQTRNTAIKAEIAAMTAHLVAELNENTTRIATLQNAAKIKVVTAKVAGDGTRTRITKECACGAKSHHVDGENATRCEVYAADMEAKAADERLHADARANYAARAAKVRARIAATA